MAHAKGLKDEHNRPARPPAELSLYWTCKNYNTLPDAGGAFDQDARLMGIMSTLGAVHGAVKRYHSYRGDEIHRMDEQTAEMVEWLTKLGLMDLGMGS